MSVFLGETIQQAKTHLIVVLGATGPCTHEQLQRELIVQCPGVTLANVAPLQVIALASLIQEGLVEEYDPPTSAWELTYSQDPNHEEFSVPIPGDPEYDVPLQVWE